MRDNRLLDGRAIRDRILDEVAERVKQAAATHAIGRLVSVSIGELKAAAVYVRGQANAARKVGFRFEDQTWPSTLTQQECKTRIVAMNDDPTCSASSCSARCRRTSTAARSRPRFIRSRTSRA
jgi:methylenetetrahydrofolate dehydrogenase (NADP+)/methenyltetrahydrofolate cyclohydrolase